MLSFVVLVAFLLSVAAFAPSSRFGVKSSFLQMADIVDTAVSAGSFKTLAAALTGMLIKQYL